MPELRVPADAAATELINEAFADVQAVGGLDGLAALRATIERPQVRAAGRPLSDGRRDYTLGSAVANRGRLWRFVFLTVRVMQGQSGTQLEAIRCRLIDPSQTDVLRHELAAVYADAEARRALVVVARPSLAWLRGGESSDATRGWAPLLEGIASTYGLRLRVFQEPERDLDETRVLSYRACGCAPSLSGITTVEARSCRFALVWISMASSRSTATGARLCFPRASCLPPSETSPRPSGGRRHGMWRRLSPRRRRIQTSSSCHRRCEVRVTASSGVRRTYGTQSRCWWLPSLPALSVRQAGSRLPWLPHLLPIRLRR